ncbi:MAG TPA: hypothetical protein VIV40_40125 [Kofleriaceae bacterium]
MKRLAGLVLVSGCYFGVRGGVDTPVRARDVAKGGVGGAVDLGFVFGDDHQSGQLLMSVGTSPLVARGDDTAAPRLAMMMMGGRYEHAFSSAHPNVRGFGRLLLGGNACAPTSMDAPKEPDQTCTDPAGMRDAFVFSTALGVALTTTRDRERHEMTPAIGSVGLALVYTYASDAVLGVGDFLGVELSAGFGGDWFTPIARKKED